MEYSKEVFTCNTVKRLVEIGRLDINDLVPINDSFNPGQSLFEIAISNEDYALFAYLLELKADPNIRSADFSTPLHNIAMNENIDTLTKVAWSRSLISAGADVNVSKHEQDGMTPLYLAVFNGCYDLAQLLIFKGADVNTIIKTGSLTNSNVTPIYMSQSEDNKMLQLLLRNGAWTNIRAPNRWRTPLICAIQCGDIERIKLLYMYNADVNFTTGIDNFNDDESPLHVAVKENFYEAVKFLVGCAEINVNAVNSHGESVLHYAARYIDNIEIVKELIDAGVDVNIVDNDGKTASNCVAENSVIREINQYLVKLQVAGFHINAINLKLINNNKYEDLRQNCLQEIQLLKKTKITSSNLTFYRVLHWSVPNSAAYLKHLDADELKESLDVLNLKIYHGKLVSIFYSISARISLLWNTEWFIHENLYEEVPYTCLKMISHYFNIEELQDLWDKLSRAGVCIE